VSDIGENGVSSGARSGMWRSRSMSGKREMSARLDSYTVASKIGLASFRLEIRSNMSTDHLGHFWLKTPAELRTVTTIAPCRLYAPRRSKLTSVARSPRFSNFKHGNEQSDIWVMMEDFWKLHRTFSRYSGIQIC
jgi:hypothetical protein